MNKRLVLIDQDEFNPASFWGVGLGNEIYSVEQVKKLPDEAREVLLTLGKSDGVLLVGPEAFKYLREFYHFGVRSENYSDCEKLTRLGIEGGAFVKVVLDFPDADTINYFMSQGFTQEVDFSWFKQKVLSDYQEVIHFLDWLDSRGADENFGFDYEASGMPLDKWFELSGAAICTEKYGGFISFNDLRETCSAEEYQTVLKRLGSFLEKRQDHVWVYNMQYEFQVSRRMLGVDLYNLRDASVFNVLDGYHMKKYSLKWTAQRILGVNVWDADFDRISDLIDSMLFAEVGKLKKEKHKELKVTIDNFRDTPEWKELSSKYPDKMEEFEYLVVKYWGNPFMCIPSSILGYYCNLDAFYTLMLYVARRSEYSQTAIDVFCDNIRLGCRLHSCGIPKDEEFRSRYEKFCKEQMTWGITYCATARCLIKMRKHEKKMANPKKYSDTCMKLLRNHTFFGGDPVLIAKEIMRTHVDEMDVYELGVDEGKLMLDYGSEFAEKLIEIVQDSMREVGFIKIDRKTGLEYVKEKIGPNIAGKKKILGVIGDKLIPILGLDKIKLGEKHIELEKYIYYEEAYNELQRISRTQLNDINKIPETIKAFGQKFDQLGYSRFVSDNYFKCGSPEENDEICFEFAKLYPAESSYLAAILESIQQLPGADKYYENLGITTIEGAFDHFMTEWEKQCNGVKETQYPDKMYDLALDFFNDLKKDEIKEVWSNFNGFIAQDTFFKYVDDEYKQYEEVFDPSDLDNNFFFMRKLVINYLLYKKYAKILTTYIGMYDPKKEEKVGMFLATDKMVIEDPKTRVVIREAEDDEPGAINKMFAHFEVLSKSSKRWSSGYHTIISHSDIKSVVRSYPGCLLSYFDIKY